MGNGPSSEQLSRLRWLSITALAAVFVVDYGFDRFMKPVPPAVYYVLFAVAVGINPRQLRELTYSFLKSLAGGKHDAPKDD